MKDKSPDSARLMLQRARAIHAALSDVQQTQQPRLFVDTDIVVGMFFRYKELLDAIVTLRRTPEDLEHYVDSDLRGRTLWYLGFTDPATLSCAHASEVYAQFAMNDVRPQQVRDISTITQYVANTLSASTMNDLTGAIADNAMSNRREDIERILPLEYVSMSVTALPGWRRRLELVGDQITFPDTTDRDILNAIMAKKAELIAVLSRRLHIERQRNARRLLHYAGVTPLVFGKNSFADICTLMELLERSSDRKCLLYTNSRGLSLGIDRLHACNELPHVYGSLYDQSSIIDMGCVDRPSGCLRSSIYICLRASLKGIGFSDSREAYRSDQEKPVTVQDLHRLVAVAEEYVTDYSHSDLSNRAIEWNQEYERLLARAMFARVWPDTNAKSLAWIRRQPEIPKGLGEAFDVIDKHKSRVITIATERLEEASRQLEGLFATAHYAELQSIRIGIGRWLLCATEPFGNIDGLVRAAEHAAAEQIGKHLEKLDEWELVYKKREGDDKTRLVACAVLFSHGRYQPIVNYVVQDARRGEVNNLTEYAISVLRTLAEWGQSSDAHHIDVGKVGGAQKQATVLFQAHPRHSNPPRCMYAMDVWQLVYGMFFRKRLGVACEWPTQGVIAARAVAAELKSLPSQKNSKAIRQMGRVLHERAALEILMYLGLDDADVRDAVASGMVKSGSGPIELLGRACYLHVTDSRSAEFSECRTALRSMELPLESDPLLEYLREQILQT